MHTTFQRISAFTAMLVLAAGASAFAAVTVEPSTSITLLSRGKGMNRDFERERVTITATSHTGKVMETANTCRSLVEVSGFKTGSRESSGTGRPNEEEHYATLHLQTKAQVGTCMLTFSDGGHSVNVHIRVEKE